LPEAVLAKPVALEITPPASPRRGVLLRRAGALRDLTRRINVIQRVDRWSSLEAAGVLLDHGYEPVWHLPNRGRSVDAIDAEIRRARARGVCDALCLRGEYKADDQPETPRIREVVRRVRALRPGARVGVTLDPHAPLQRALANLWPKLEAGATSVQLQVCLDLASTRPAAEQLKERRSDVAVRPMLMPVLSPEAARRVARRLSIPLPTALLRRLEAGGEEAGWAWLHAQVTQLAGDPLFAGLAIMTPIDQTPAYRDKLDGLLRDALRLDTPPEPPACPQCPQ
jgi:5,10-methylenetetrahydrofolate reductase